ncbi:hypothetical protein ACFQ1T_01855 [Methylophilus glucosoxydans]|uniref:DUF4062 domain-containing protein n=1 Tax=Methylophilus glucosoxydans TaxID=752553 RepID=A0ABW3GIP1_9PROT
MAQTGTIFRALVASPSDCIHERKIIPEVIATWNAVHSLSAAAIIEPVLWEMHSRPGMGSRPQEVINRQLVTNCDLVIGAFWTRLGTPTGVSESGTAEEIEHFREAGKPVLLYFSSAPVVPESLDAEQYKALTEYKKRLGQEGLYFKYETLSEFRELLQRHLAGEMIELLKQIPTTNLPTEMASSSATEQQQALTNFCADFEAFLRRLTAEWEAERDSDPHSTDDGKYIMSRAADEVLHFKSMITEDGTGVSQSLGEILKRLRTHQRHQTYIDGGVSFKTFWDEGDQLISAIREQVSKLRELSKNA